MVYRRPRWILPELPPTVASSHRRTHRSSRARGNLELESIIFYLFIENKAMAEGHLYLV
jgi:hypothetical protein